jgi:non-ribosomal peptide synthetase component F
MDYLFKFDYNFKYRSIPNNIEHIVVTYHNFYNTEEIDNSTEPSQEDIVVGSPVVGRTIAETNNLIGMFVNTLALRNTVNSTLSFKEFVLSIKENVLNAYKYQAYPFDELINKLDLKRDTSRSPLFDTMFIYQNNGYLPATFDGINSEYYIPNAKISKFDLSLEVIPNNNSLDLSFEYCTKLFNKSFIENLSSI